MNSNERGDSVQYTHMHGGVGVFCMLCCLWVRSVVVV